MIVVGICGSPRKNGNTEILLDKALEGAASQGAKTVKVVLNRLDFVPCQECAVVRDDGTCKVKDDFQGLYEKIRRSDAVIVASPIFFGSLSAQTKMMIDRFQCHWRARYILKVRPFPEKKRACFISVEASTRRDFFENAKSIIRNFFATINAGYDGELFVTGVDEKGRVSKRRESLIQAFELGRKIAS